MSRFKYKLVEQDEPQGYLLFDKSQLTEEYLQKSNSLLKRLDKLVKQGEELLEKRKKNGFKK
jgi:CHASE3 domain sensor protein